MRRYTGPGGHDPGAALLIATGPALRDAFAGTAAGIEHPLAAVIAGSSAVGCLDSGPAASGTLGILNVSIWHGWPMTPAEGAASFPPDFVFGVATSAFQIEGAWDEDGKGPSIWDTFGHTPGKVHRDIPADVAVDHYHRFHEDIALMCGLGIGSYRFSVSWPRVLPEGTGRVNRAGLDFYRRLVDELLGAGISPNLTLYHWDLPQALEDRGGWGNRDVALWFRDYAALLFEEFDGLVPRWTTLNEPIAIWVGYGTDLFAPGHADPRLGRQGMHNALLAHGEAVRAFRDLGTRGEIGIVIDIWKRHPASADPADAALARREDDDSFRFFLDPLLGGGYRAEVTERLARAGTIPEVRGGDLELIAAPVDFLGLNVYSRVVVSAKHQGRHVPDAGEEHPGGNFLDNGTEFYPRAVYDAIRLVREDYGWTGPVYITENGTPDPDTAGSPAAGRPLNDTGLNDLGRIRYLRGFLSWIARAISEGADVRGYYLWSLLDNYEWAAGFSKRFGIVQVDPDTLTRVPKASYWWYRDVVAGRTLDAPPEVNARLPDVRFTPMRGRPQVNRQGPPAAPAGTRPWVSRRPSRRCP